MSNSRKRKQKKKKAKKTTIQQRINKERKAKMALSSKISEDRKIEIYVEAKRRMKLWLVNSTFDEMTVMGSKMRFDMALGLSGGYPFEEPEWMKDKSFNDFVTKDEFESPEYDEIIDQLFEKAENN